MAVSFSCRCDERSKPPDQRSWGVIARRCNYSTFNGGRYTPSDYSEIVCLSCGAIGRTKAKYVDQLRDCQLVDGDWQLV